MAAAGIAVARVGPGQAGVDQVALPEVVQQADDGSGWDLDHDRTLGELPIEHVTIEGQSSTCAFPREEPVTYRSCDSGGATFHFCPECGSTVYWEIAAAPELLGVAIGTFADPTFPPPMISGFAAEGAAWAMNVSELPMPGGRYDYDGTSHGGPRA